MIVQNTSATEAQLRKTSKCVNMQVFLKKIILTVDEYSMNVRVLTIS